MLSVDFTSVGAMRSSATLHPIGTVLHKDQWKGAHSMGTEQRLEINCTRPTHRALHRGLNNGRNNGR